MASKEEARLYWRGGRAYGDFRAYQDVGGGREALKLDGKGRGTTDAVLAMQLFAERLKDLEARRRGQHLHGDPGERLPLGTYCKYHLEAKAKAKAVTTRWLAQTEAQLRPALEFFGVDRDLRSITPPDVRAYVNHLRSHPNGRGGKLGDGSLRHYLNSLGNVLARAVADGKLRTGNPVHQLLREDKPKARRAEAKWLDPQEAAKLLEAARTFKPDPNSHAAPFVYPLLATYLLTGGRRLEVLGLLVDDVSFKLGRVFFRPNRWRRLKTRGSERSVPLWPQLHEILADYMMDRERRGELDDGLLFPSPRPGPKHRGLVTDFRKSLDLVAERAGWKAGEIRSKAFRHTYASQRIQTLDHGAPVSVFTVARELGHTSTQMVEQRYGHLAHTRERAEVVEFRKKEPAPMLREDGRRLAGVEEKEAANA